MAEVHKHMSMNTTNEANVDLYIVRIVQNKDRFQVFGWQTNLAWLGWSRDGLVVSGFVVPIVGIGDGVSSWKRGNIQWQGFSRAMSWPIGSKTQSNVGHCQMNEQTQNTILNKVLQTFVTESCCIPGNNTSPRKTHELAVSQ